ncbi:hypothetical protein WJX79_007959 [Trebouxia sp. C0005]
MLNGKPRISPLRSKQPFNLLFRLRQRETTAAPPSAHINQVRILYECLPPTSLVCKVEPPDTHLCRFTPSGTYLPPAGWAPPNAGSFDSHFRQVFRVTLAHGTETLVKDFLLTLHDERFLLVIKTSPPTHGESIAAGVPSVPVIESTTLVLVKTTDGSITDTYLLQDDFVHLSHNFGVYLWDDLLLIVGVRQQTLYILQVLPSGRFVKVQSIGALCNDDDQLMLEMHEEQERQWQAQRFQAGQERQADHCSAGPGPSSSSSSSAAPLSMPRSSSLAAAPSFATATARLPLPAADPRQPLLHQVGAVRHGPGRQPFPAPQPALHSIPSQVPAAAAAVVPAGKSPLIQGLKHKILVHLLMKKQQEAAAGNHEALKQFHYVFETYVNLLMWKAQFLDRDHLLIALGHPDTVMARNMDVAPGLVFFVVYDMATSTVRKITSNNTDGMMMAYMRHASMFHAADIRNDWDRYVTPALVGLHPPNQQERVITRQWGYPVAVRRILANVPVSCQVLSASPYLDGNLFQYDDKYISATVRPRVYGDSILRFVSKQHPESAKFKIAGDPFDIPPTHGRAIKQYRVCCSSPDRSAGQFMNVLVENEDSAGVHMP